MRVCQKNGGFGTSISTNDQPQRDGVYFHTMPPHDEGNASNYHTEQVQDGEPGASVGLLHHGRSRAAVAGL